MSSGNPQIFWRSCPECGFEVDAEEIICPGCGHALPSARVAADASQLFVDARQKPRAAGRLWLGAIVGVVAGFAQMQFGQWVFHHAHAIGNGIITANFVIIPLLSGLLGSFYWCAGRPTATTLIGYSSLTALLMLITLFILNLSGYFVGMPGGWVVFGWSLFFFIPAIFVLTVVVWCGSMLGNVMFRNAD